MAGSDTGSMSVELQDEYVKDWTSETDGPTGGVPTQVGPQTSGLAGQAPPSPITVSVTQGVSVTVGISVTGGVPGTDFGIDASTSVGTDTADGGSVAVACPAKPSLTMWTGCLVPMVLTVTGCGYQYGPEGVVSTDNLTETRPTSPYADAVSNLSAFAKPPPTTPVMPVSP